jgi:hypothetical protein
MTSIAALTASIGVSKKSKRCGAPTPHRVEEVLDARLKRLEDR